MEFPTRSSLPLFFMISGPSASGKTTLAERMLGEFKPNLQRVITTTTRKPRQGEHDGIDYHFLQEDEFQEQVKGGAFYEWAKVHKNFYGTYKREVDNKLTNGIDLLVNIDVQGAETFREVIKKNPDFPGRLISVFIAPKNLNELRKRIIGRNLDEAEIIERRIETAKTEIEQWPAFDYCIISGSRKDDFDRFRSIYLAEKVRVLEGLAK